MAASQLFKIRTDFVDRSSSELINQLLDDLLQDKILNDGEKDSILEENKARADKARCLVDVVKKKGDAASQKLIEHIKERDPFLATELGL